MGQYDWLYVDPPPQFIPDLGKFASARGELWDGIDKKLDFQSHDSFGAPHVIAVDSSATGFGLTKLSKAGPEGQLPKALYTYPKELIDKVSEIVLGDSDPDKAWMVGIGLGATEKWSCNENGDSFPRLGLTNDDRDTYGHKTWEKHANIFVHHQNKDPKKGIGKIPFAYYDHLMDRVLFLWFILKSLAPHLVNRMENGGSFPTSIGVKCPYDVCSLLSCRKKAKDRSEYCEHLRDYPKRIMLNGEKVMAHTPHPRGFDHSHVIKGADRISHAMTLIDKGGMAKKSWDSRTKYHPMYSRTSPEMDKVAAHLSPAAQFLKDHGAQEIHSNGQCFMGDPSDPWTKEDKEQYKRLKGADDKASEIIKYIPGFSKLVKDKPSQPVEEFAKKALWILEATEPSLPIELLDKLSSEYRLGEILTTLGSKGIVVKPEEFAYLVDKAATLEPRDFQIDKTNLRRRMLEKISTDLIEAKSCRPEALYKRALSLLRPISKVAVDKQNPRGMQIIIMSPGGNNPLGALTQGLPSVTGLPHVSPLIPQLLALEALYRGYRTNLGAADPHHAFDDPVGMPGLHHLGKHSSILGSPLTSEFIEACQGIPMRSYLKYAHLDHEIDTRSNETPAVSIEMPCSTVLLRELVAAPLGDFEKVSTVLDLKPGGLLDAATTITLRFVSDALAGIL